MRPALRGLARVLAVVLPRGIPLRLERGHASAPVTARACALIGIEWHAVIAAVSVHVGFGVFGFAVPLKHPLAAAPHLLLLGVIALPTPRGTLSYHCRQHEPGCFGDSASAFRLRPRPRATCKARVQRYLFGEPLPILNVAALALFPSERLTTRLPSAQEQPEDRRGAQQSPERARALFRAASHSVQKGRAG